MKLSVSMRETDVKTLDAYVASHAGATRSSALQRAIELLREQSLLEQYDVAMDQWSGDDDANAWDVTAGDAL